MTDVPQIAPVVEQHAEEAAFLWLTRANAVHAPHYSLADVAKVDGRLEAHLDGLRVAGAAGWELALQQLSRPEAGEFFAAAVLAVESRERAKLELVFDRITESEPARGAVSALGWVSWAAAEPVVRWLLDAADPARRRMGIAACAITRRNPGDYLANAMRDHDAGVRARALRAAGELGRRDLIENLRAGFIDEDGRCRLAAAWSATLLGDPEATTTLRRAAEVGGAGSGAARRLLLRALDRADAHALLKAWAQDPALQRRLIQACGDVGDPVYVPWLIERMAVPPLARVAGEAFSAIVGADLAFDDLDRPPPPGHESGPTDDPTDEDVSLDRDDGLPWPDPERVALWWRERQRGFPAGTRLLLGRKVEPEGLLSVLKTGRQRQRAAAALELALVHPGTVLFETRARGSSQRRQLGA
jgi:uncharacterized protein (TIGR02270 family)